MFENPSPNVASVRIDLAAQESRTLTARQVKDQIAKDVKKFLSENKRDITS